MPSDSIVDRLAALPLLQSVPRTELEWLVERGDRSRRLVQAVFRVGGIRYRLGSNQPLQKGLQSVHVNLHLRHVKSSSS